MEPQPVAILGFQYGRPGTGPRLAQLNTALGNALTDPAVPGLLRYQVLVHSSRPERICVYWFWRQAADRDAVWASPPQALTEFWEHSRPLWAREPEVGRYVWRPSADRDLCPHGSAVRLTPLPLTQRNECGEGARLGLGGEGQASPEPRLCGLDGAQSLCLERIPRGTPGESWISVGRFAACSHPE